MKLVTKSNITHIEAVFKCPLTSFCVEVYFEREVTFKNMKLVIAYFISQINESVREEKGNPFEMVMLKIFLKELRAIHNDLCVNGKLMRSYRSNNTEIHIKPVKVKGFIK